MHFLWLTSPKWGIHLVFSLAYKHINKFWTAQGTIHYKIQLKQGNKMVNNARNISDEAAAWPLCSRIYSESPVESKIERSPRKLINKGTYEGIFTPYKVKLNQVRNNQHKGCNKGSICIWTSQYSQGQSLWEHLIRRTPDKSNTDCNVCKRYKNIITITKTC